MLGSCSNEGDDPPTCELDSDCPEWQTCIAGGCYSDCTLDSECDQAAGYCGTAAFFNGAIPGVDIGGCGKFAICSE